jgi:hypothetical protein
MRRHRRRVNRAGHGAGDDDLVVLRHDFSLQEMRWSRDDVGWPGLFDALRRHASSRSTSTACCPYSGRGTGDSEDFSLPPQRTSAQPVHLPRQTVGHCQSEAAIHVGEWPDHAGQQSGWQHRTGVASSRCCPSFLANQPGYPASAPITS